MTKDEVRVARDSIERQFDATQQELHRLQGEYRAYTRVLESFLEEEQPDPAKTAKTIEVKEDISEPESTTSSK